MFFRKYFDFHGIRRPRHLVFCVRAVLAALVFGTLLAGCEKDAANGGKSADSPQESTASATDAAHQEERSTDSPSSELKNGENTQGSRDSAKPSGAEGDRDQPAQPEEGAASPSPDEHESSSESDVPSEEAPDATGGSDESEKKVPKKDVDEEGNSAAEGSETDSADPGEDEVAEIEEKSPFSDPAEALVAIRGDARAGLGTLALFEGNVVAVTSISALEGNRRILANTPDGVEIPVVGVAGVYGKDLAFLAMNAEGLDLPVAELNFDASVDPKDKVKILDQRGETDVTLAKGNSGRMNVDKLERQIFPGSPVVRDGKIIGVFSPARVVGAGSGRKGGGTAIWSDAVVPLPSSPRWEVIVLPVMAVERESLDQALTMINELSALLGVGARDKEATMQRLIAARKRLADGLERSNQELERDNARRGFIFSVKSATGAVEADLQEVTNGSYSYFAPEVSALVDLFRPVQSKINALEKNPRSADSFAR